MRSQYYARNTKTMETTAPKKNKDRDMQRTNTDQEKSRYDAFNYAAIVVFEQHGMLKPTENQISLLATLIADIVRSTSFELNMLSSCLRHDAVMSQSFACYCEPNTVAKLTQIHVNEESRK